MLKPSKHSNPNKTILAVSSIMLAYLMRYRAASYDKLYETVKKKFTGADVLFVPSLNFLYSLGLLEYQSKTDMFEYIEKKK